MEADEILVRPSEEERIQMHLNIARGAREYSRNAHFGSASRGNMDQLVWGVCWWLPPMGAAEPDDSSCRARHEPHCVRTQPLHQASKSAQQHAADDRRRRNRMCTRNQQDFWHVALHPKSHASGDKEHQKHDKSETEEKGVDAIGSLAKAVRLAHFLSA
eukprot:216304-Prymnesium_polylepis.1